MGKFSRFGAGLIQSSDYNKFFAKNPYFQYIIIFTLMLIFGNIYSLRKDQKQLENQTREELFKQVSAWGNKKLKKVEYYRNTRTNKASVITAVD